MMKAVDKQAAVLGLCVLALTAGRAWGAVITVSKDGRGQYSSVQAAVDAAGKGDVVKILDAAVYDEQVDIDSTKAGLTLTSANPLSLNKPVIRWQDTRNVGPRTCQEALVEEKVTFDQNGALRLLRTRNVTIDGIAVDGGGPKPFAYPGVWGNGVDCSGQLYPLFHGNAAITVWISGDIHIRNCDIRNAYFGINTKDRNEGGIFANANPADVEKWNVVPLSGFGKTGNHLFEHNRIHDNSWGMFFESTWDLGSTIRYNLFYENHHSDSLADVIKNDLGSYDGNNQPGGALFFKDHLLSPLAIHNNTFWHNFLIFAGHWRAGSQHLVFNNIYGAPHRFWGDDPNFQNPFHKMDHVFKYRMKHCVYASQSQAPTEYHVAIMNDFQMQPTGGPIPQGTLITTPFPAEADIRWLETVFKSTDPSSPDFLTPDWDDTLVQKFIVDKGWPAAGITDPDGSIADLGAIPSGGGRIQELIVVKPVSPVIINGTTATMTFDVSVNEGSFTAPSIAYIRFIKNVEFHADAFGGNAAPVPATDIIEVAIPAGTQIQPGSNTLTVTVPPRGPDELYAFFELILVGTGSSGQPVTSTVGFMPYRKLEYGFRVTVLDITGTTELTEVHAGEPVKLKIEAFKADGSMFVNEVNPVEVTLNSGADLLDPNGAIFDIASILGSTIKVVVFTHVPDGGVEYVMVSGLWEDPGSGNSVAFYGVSDGIRILPGPPAVVRFEDPPSNADSLATPPVIDPGLNYRGYLQVFDLYGNEVNQAVQVSLSSSRPEWADIVGSTSITTDTTGRGTFQVAVVNGPKDSVFTLHAEVDSSITDDADMRIGTPLDQLWIFYADVGDYTPGTELRGQIGERLQVTIWASIDGVSPIASRTNTITVAPLASASSLRFYASATATDTLSTITLVDGAATVWVTSFSPVTDGAMQVYDNTDFTLVAGDKSTRGGIYFSRNPTVIDSAFVYADNGVGAADRVEIYYRNELPAAPDSVVLYWPNKQAPPRVVHGGDAQMSLAPDNHHVTITLTTPFDEGVTFGNGPNGAGFGASWDRPNPDVPAEETAFYLSDRVGPLLIDTAWVHERFSAGADTITVMFSERVDAATITAAAFELYKPSSATPLTVVVVGTATTAGGATSYTFAIEDLGVHAPTQGDSLCILSSGPLRDAYGNAAHPDNEGVPVAVRRRPAPLTQAWYEDRDADGTVDTVVVGFARPVDIDAINRLDIVWCGDTVAVLPTLLSPSPTDSTAVVAAVSAVLGPDAAGQTGGAMQVTVLYRDHAETFSVPAADSAAPVLITAAYRPGSIESPTLTHPDTLVVTFSETVSAIDVDEPFDFVSARVGEYGMQLAPVQHDGAGYTFTVVELDSAIQYPGSSDSVWIDPAAGVTDLGGTPQSNPDNRRVPLDVTARPYRLVTRVGPNPFDPRGGEVTLVDNGTTVGSYRGTIIEIDPLTDLQSGSDDGDITLTGTVAVYDAMGSMVADYAGDGDTDGPIEMVESPVSSKMYFVWNGCNNNGRYVGSGSYVAVVTVKDNEGGGDSFRKTLGVKR